MAQINFTLNEEEILQLLKEDQGGAFRTLLTKALDTILLTESDEQIHAAKYERSEEREDYRNGSRDRDLVTRIGKITLSVPRHRLHPFETAVFDHYQRSEAALIVTMAQMVVEGVSTRKVDKVIHQLCGEHVSKSAVSNATKKLDAIVNEFKTRPLDDEYPFLIMDGTYLKVHKNGRIQSIPLLVVIGTDAEGHRAVLDFDLYRSEDTESWADMLRKLKARGLHGVRMITSDDCGGLRKAMARELPQVPWQRCQFHFKKNILEKVPVKYKIGLEGELIEMFNSSDIETAIRRRDAIVNEYYDIADSAMNVLLEGFDDAMTVMHLPEQMRKAFRTSNRIERLNNEIKRRSKVIGIFPDEDSVLRLIGCVLIDQNEVWSSVEHRDFYSPAYKELLARTDELGELSREQISRLAA
jgi:putative transposase